MAIAFQESTAFVTVQKLPTQEGPWMTQVGTLCGLDLYSLRMQLRQHLPFIMAARERAVADACVDAIQQAGGRAVAPSWKALCQVGRPEEAQGFELDASQLTLTLPKGQTAVVARHELMLLLPASVKKRTRESRSDPLPLLTRQMRRGAFGRTELADTTTTTVDITQDEFLFLMQRDGRCLRVARGFRFPPEWGSPWDWRAHLKRLTQLLLQWDETITVESGFARFVPPRDIQLRMDQVFLSEHRETVIRSDESALDFYLKWRFCLEAPPSTG